LRLRPCRFHRRGLRESACHQRSTTGSRKNRLPIKVAPNRHRDAETRAGTEWWKNVLWNIRQFSKQQCTIAGLRLYLTSTETPLSKYCLRQQISKNWKNDAVLPRIIIYYLNGRLATDGDPYTVVCVVFTGIARHSWTGISFVYTHFNVFRQLITSNTITKMSIRIILIRSVID
jgi:hypothetical protein